MRVNISKEILNSRVRDHRTIRLLNVLVNRLIAIDKKEEKERELPTKG